MFETLFWIIGIGLIYMWIMSLVSQVMVKWARKNKIPGMQEVSLKWVFLAATVAVVAVYLYSLYVK